MTTTPFVVGVPMPPRRQRYLEIVRPRPNSLLNVFCVSESITGLQLHYVDGRTRICDGHANGCQHCMRQTPRRWRGFIHASQSGTWGALYISELTLEVADRLAARKPADVSIRGCYWSLRRGNGPQARITLVDFDPHPRTKNDPPPPVDLLPTLVNIFQS